MKKRILSLWLVFVLCLSLMPMSAFAATPSMQNVSISADGILSWDAVPGAAKYRVSVGSGGGSVTGTSDDLNNLCAGIGYDTGDYTVRLYAIDSAGTTSPKHGPVPSIMFPHRKNWRSRQISVLKVQPASGMPSLMQPDIL